MATAPKEKTSGSKSVPPATSKTLGELSPGRAPIKRRIKKRYDRHMPDKKRHRVLIWVVFLLCSTVVALQLLYPPDRALPLTRVKSQYVAWQNHEQLAEVISSQFSETKLRIVVEDGASVELPLATAGAEPNTEPMIKQVVEYPFWQRFIPFSILLHNDNIVLANVYFTVSVLEKTSQKYAQELSFAPVNARLAIEDGKLVATSEERGKRVSAEEVYGAVASITPALGEVTEVTVRPERIDPEQTAESLSAVRAAAEAALARAVRVVADDHTFVPDDAAIASWLQIGTDEAGKPTLTVASDKINEFFDSIDAEVGVAAGQTNINLTNGHETSRNTGRTGRAINRDELSKQLVAWLLEGQGQGSFTATFHDVPPSVIYDNKYTATEEGLRAYVADAARRMNVHIAVQQVDGGKWSASARAGESIPSASTYKLFVAKWLFDQMDKGLVRWDDPMLDTSVSECFDRMTIASTNPCAEAWLAQAGRANFNQYIWGELGFSQGTNFNMPVATHTTADDLQRMMLGIYHGTLLSGAHKDRLLHSLSVHPFRYGIPTGSAGKVYDKVGFLWDYVHDTAIVEHPSGTYIMTIMTKGQSYAMIASLTREIERIMYP